MHAWEERGVLYSPAVTCPFSFGSWSLRAQNKQTNEAFKRSLSSQGVLADPAVLVRLSATRVAQVWGTILSL